MDKVSYYLSRISAATAGASIFLMMWMISLNVVMRKVFNRPLVFTEEYSGFLFIFIIFMGLSYVTRQGLHITVEIAYRRFSKKIQNIMDVATMLLNSIVVATYSFFALKVFIQALHMKEESIVTYTPIWIPTVFMCLGLLLFLLEALNRLIKSISIAIEYKKE